jgi:hypothetical protein
MTQVTIKDPGPDYDGYIEEGDEVVLCEGGVTIEVTRVNEDGIEDAIIFEAVADSGSPSYYHEGFIDCGGPVQLDGNAIRAYYVADANNREIGAMTFVLVEVM